MAMMFVRVVEQLPILIAFVLLMNENVVCERIDVVSRVFIVQYQYYCM